jgi:hypothetical protein
LQIRAAILGMQRRGKTLKDGKLIVGQSERHRDEPPRLGEPLTDFVLTMR